MKSSGLLLVASVCALALRAADATTPIDYTKRNAPLAPAESVATEKQKPRVHETLQEKRVPTNVVDKSTAPLADRRAPVEMNETREKHVIDKSAAPAGAKLDGVRAQREQAAPTPASAFQRKQAAISTAADTKKPPTVAKYQDSLTAVNGVKVAPLRALDGATSAKINRFVFRKNPPESSTALNGASVTPAGGGGAIRK